MKINTFDPRPEAAKLMDYFMKSNMSGFEFYYLLGFIRKTFEDTYPSIKNVIVVENVDEEKTN